MKRVALDIMGGDLSASASIPGLWLYISRNPCESLSFDLFGNAAVVESFLEKFPGLRSANIEIHDTKDNVISASDQPAAMVKKGRGTSMFEAISYVAEGKADAVVSSGNTGAFMALSKILLGTIDCIDRPALVSMLPSARKKCLCAKNSCGEHLDCRKTVMLDLGANTDCNAVKLIQFAFMGQAVAKILLKIDYPIIGLLNIGTERTKGTKELNTAYAFLEKAKEINFSGFVEGTDIFNGSVDVVVTDGFTGNVSLKTMEGSMKYVVDFLKNEYSKNMFTKFSYFLSSKIFKNLKQEIDPTYHNGAPLVGLKNVAVKSHGNSDAVGVANAISVAINLVNSGFIESITALLQTLSRGVVS